VYGPGCGAVIFDTHDSFSILILFLQLTLTQSVVIGDFYVVGIAVSPTGSRAGIGR
jgi:hypothetical protein